MKTLLRRRLPNLLLSGDTAMLRFWFALCSYGWALYILLSPISFVKEHPLALWARIPPAGLGILFLVYASAVVYGVVTRRFSLTLLALEGFLGVSLWGWIGLTDAYAQSAPGPTFFGGIVALFLLIRYPTFKKRGDTDADA